MSLSHIIGDGKTFYSLYGMLSSEEIPKPLRTERFEDYQHKLDEMMGGNDTLSWVLSPGVIINIIKTLVFTPSVHATLFDVDTRWIDEQKQLHMKNLTSDDPPFVSTNDILTSWFLKLCKCDVGLFAMNFRDRMPEITAHHAGNYEALVALQPADLEPQGIRKSVQLYRQAFSKSLPSFWNSTSANISVISTWATFYRDLHLPGGAQQIRHSPLVETEMDVAFRNVGIVFKSSSNQYSMLTATRSIDKQKFSSEPGIALIY